MHTVSKVVGCAIAMTCILTASTAHAQGTSITGSSYQPGVDVVDYDIRIDLPDTGAFIRGDVIVTALRAPGVTSLRLDLASALTVRTVTVNGVRVQPGRDGPTLRVPVLGATGDTVRVRVQYDGVVTDGLIVQHDKRGRWTWFGDNWPDRTRDWLPTVDHPSDKATVSFTVRAPSSRTVVANGSLLGVRALGGAESGRSETRWRESRPIATYLMVIGAGSMTRTDLPDASCSASTVHRCVPQMVYTTPENADFVPGPFAAAPAIVSYFEELVGPFPYEKLAHLQSATRFGGMENASAIFYADRLFPEHSLRDGLIAHETAHQWFGDAVTEREWGHLWLSEGFATYFAALWTRRAHGDSSFARELAVMRTQILADSVVAAHPVIDTLQHNYLALLNTNSYQKGGYVLFMLNRELGDAAFFAGLRAYYARYRDGNAVTDDLQREMEQSSHRSLQQFFDQWLRRPGVAEAEAGWAYDPSTRKLSISVLQDRGALPYALSLPVTVRMSNGAVVRAILPVPAERRAEVRFTREFPERPVSVEIDPDGQVLARFTRM